MRDYRGHFEVHLTARPAVVGEVVLKHEAGCRVHDSNLASDVGRLPAGGVS